MSAVALSLSRRLPQPALSLAAGAVGGLAVAILWRVFLGRLPEAAYGSITNPFHGPNGQLVGLAAGSLFAFVIALPRLCLP